MTAPLLTREQQHLAALYGLCPECQMPNQPVTEKLAGRWSMRMACGCPGNEPQTRKDGD